MGREDKRGRSHRRGGIRPGLWNSRLPLLSLGLGILWIAIHLVVEIGYAGQLDQARAELGHSVEFFIEHPMLRIEPRMLPVLRDAMPGYEGNEVFSFLSRKEATQSGPSPQDVLDEKVWNAFGLLDAHPHRKLGLVPVSAQPYAYATYALLHAGWLHLLGSLLLLLTVGPLLERTFGRVPFAAMCLAAGIGGAALYAYSLPNSDRPLVGGTAIVIGMVSAALIRFKNQGVDFAEWLSPWLDVEMRAPVWFAAIPAVGLVGAIVPLTDGDLPTSIDVASGYLSYAVASLIGVSFAVVYMKNGIEKRYGNTPKPVPVVQPRAPRRFDMRSVERAQEAGDVDTAYSALHDEALRSPGKRDVVLAFWALALEIGRTAEAVPAVFQLIREELRRGAVEVAASHWCRVVDAAGDARLDAKTLAVLLPWIQKLGGADKTILALEHTMHRGAEAKDRLPPAAVADIAFLAAEIAPDIAEQAAELALVGSGLSEERRAELEDLRNRIAPKEAVPGEYQTPGGELPENAFYAEQDRSAFDAGTDDLGGLLPDELGNLPPVQESSPAQFPSVNIALAVPRALEPEALVLSVGGQGEARLAYSRICGVTIAGVGGLAAKPIVVVDLLLSGPDPDDLPLEVVRLRGDQFDPRRLVAGDDAPLPALRAFVGEVLNRSGGAAIPSREILDPQTGVQMFETVEVYQRDLLRVKS